ncbi:MAG TPA: glycosyltransferase family 39 protein [Candidatus Dormibacteraeota bacterium]|nr:glycosyltransferase family 39 protein [Candidatus Dormibacteraeota bacterium]
MRRRADLLLLSAALTLFVAFAVAYSRLTPLGQTPDESAHLNNVVQLALHLQLPGLSVREHKQPPLFYLLGAGVYKVTQDPLLVRLASLACGLGAAITIFVVARRLLPGRRMVPAAAAALFALLPEAQYLSAAVNNESSAWLAGALVLLMIVEAIRRDTVGLRFLALCGVVSGVALLAKETVWVLVLVLVVVLLVRHARRSRLLGAVAYVVPTVAVAGWWFVRNLLAFHALTPPLLQVSSRPQYLRSFSQLRGFLAATFDSTIGSYGDGMHLKPITLLGARPMPSLMAAALIGAAALVFLVALLRYARAWDRPRRVMAAVLALCVALVLAQYVFNSVTVDLQPQARYLIVAAALFTTAFAWAAARLFTLRILTWLSGVLVMLAIVLDVSGLITASRLPG